MNTPIADFVKSYAESGISRLHMPGHKGVELLGCEKLDITELQGADVLYSADGIIAESENNASSLFGTEHTYYSTEGSSLCIKAMLAIATAEKKQPVLAARNIHKSFLYGAALLDLNVEWLYPENTRHICECKITPEALKAALDSMPELPSAVYITSPDYLGNVQDIKGLSAVCHEYKVPLLVDNAHGAYLNFLENKQHPISLGADMCCDSAHKTLPVLTGGAYLHISKTAPRGFSDNARRFLSVFASTSPSYLILQSLDLCNRYLSDGYKERLHAACRKVATLKKHLSACGWIFYGDELLKITVNCSACGHSGHKMADILRSFGVEPEFADRDVVVLMFTPENDEKDFSKVSAAFTSVSVGQPSEKPMPPLSEPIVKASLKCAVFAPQTTVAVDSAVGLICAAPLVSCPPAVPPVMSGEVITEQVIEVLKYCGIKTIDVIK